MALTLKQKRRIRRRIETIGDRLDRLQKRIAAWDDAESSGMLPWLLQIIQRLVDAGKLPPIDKEDDLDWDEVFDAVVEWLDDHVEPDDPKLEWLTDIGFEIAAFVAVQAFKNRKAIIEARIVYNKALLKKLRARLDAG